MLSSRLLNSLIRTHPAVLLVLWGQVILALAVYGIRQHAGIGLLGRRSICLPISPPLRLCRLHLLEQLS